MVAAILLMLSPVSLLSQNQKPSQSLSSPQGMALSEFVAALRQKAKALENTYGMRLGFQTFTAAQHLAPEGIHYSDYVLVRLLFEATRDAGFWNLHWQITDQPPNSDRIWRQWRDVRSPSPTEPTAIAECDELSALFAFLVERAGVKTVGLFWPASNHTVAVWVLQPASGPVIRVVVPTTQIYLDETDRFDTRKFNPWRQKTIYEYTRHDVPDSFVISKPLADFFLQQIDKYAGASDSTLQRLRYLRDAILNRTWTPEQAARDALSQRAALAPGLTEDAAALQTFAEDVRMESFRH
jgi:hypothetical protein